MRIKRIETKTAQSAQGSTSYEGGKHPDLWRMEDAAIYLGRSVRTIQKWRKKKRGFPEMFTTPKTGNTLFFNRYQIERWRESHA